jgi:hypothetical protein
MWWAIACARAYKITNDERYLKKAKVSFDFVHDNYLDATLGGGLYWINQRTSKNSCLNSPAVIAAVRLSVLLKDASYLEKAKSWHQDRSQGQNQDWRGGHSALFGRQGHSGSRSADQAKGADSQELLKLSSKQGSLTPIGDHCGRRYEPRSVAGWPPGVSVRASTRCWRGIARRSEASRSKSSQSGGRGLSAGRQSAALRVGSGAERTG